jgi:HSP20 family protein
MNPNVSLPALLSRLGRLPGNLEELMGSLAAKPRDWWMQSFPYPLVNVREEADAVHVEADLPGVGPDQLEVLIRHGTELTLQGERKPLSGETGTWHQRERSEGRFQRVVMLPVAVDATKVQAILEQGVLHLVLPKAESVKPHRIPVQGNNGEAKAPRL